MRNSAEFEISDINTFKRIVLRWSQLFTYSAFLNNNNQEYPSDPFINILAVSNTNLSFIGIDDFEELKKHHQKNNDWLIGYFGYDLKNQLENLESNNTDLAEFPDITFFSPEHLIFIHEKSIRIETFDDPKSVIDAIIDTSIVEPTEQKPNSHVRQLVGKNDYLKIVQQLQEHIIEGDIYEINYCIPFKTQLQSFDPPTTYESLIAHSPTPFSVYFKNDHHYLMCASPERFIKKEDKKLTSQPIKGTIRRGKSPEEDELLRDQLRNSEKERAENMMIVDLVRNDLARSCKPGSVVVEEMFGVYPFKYLFQMISTISGELREQVHFIDAIKNAFPMGSMTGAPKIKAMQLIEKYEVAKRGVFSGAVGYITPNGDFDFNVVIRSIFYNQLTSQLSFQAGSAITYDSIPEQEYDECMLKVKAILAILGLDEENLHEDIESSLTNY